LTVRLFVGVVSETNSENYPSRSQKEISQKTVLSVLLLPFFFLLHILVNSEALKTMALTISGFE
jgi:hypothetical protein